MYTPYFQITPKVTEYLTRIGIIYGYLKSTLLPTKYKKEYQNKILSEIIHSSTAIEGNALTHKQVQGVLKGNKIKGYERDVKEVENYYNAIKYISSFPINTDFKVSEENVLKINKIILTGIRDDEAGKYRTKELYVGTYIPPKPRAIPDLMTEFIDWLNNPTPFSLSPILYAGIAHYKLVEIHPFIDGNGRTARILTKLVLKKFGYDFIRYFSLESYYNRERKLYYSALDSADSHRVNGESDLSIWLEYFTLALFVQAQRAQTQIETLIKIKPRQIKLHLNERQKKIILYLKDHNSITTSEYIKISDLSTKGAYNDLQKLVKAGLIEKKGILKSSFYVLRNYK